MTYPLHVAFVWHMHQPYYKDAFRGTYTLPWVRLHATKDYLHMVELLDDFPRIHQTFNLVPCLVEQLQDYSAGRAIDRCLAVTLKERLSDDDKRFMVSFFFHISWDKIIRRYPRYWQLLKLRQELDGDVNLLSDQYWLDLAAWFNLAWIDPSYCERDRELRALVEKGRDFTRGDVLTIARKQREILSRTLEAYREAESRGQIEISTSPYYHPILPLLVDSEAAREASHGLPLPSNRFRCPEDAAEQLRRGLELHEQVFGRTPRGLWPSEGAVSQSVVEILESRTSLRWLASDEGILARSLGISLNRDGYGHLHDPRPLCQPYSVGSEGVAAIFRDHLLSDRIGFVYKHMGSQEAAEDLVHRLLVIYERVSGDNLPYLVAIILDGENCWEEYANNGTDFLRHLYQRLSEDARLRTVTVSEYLDEFPPRNPIARLAAGSWIGANLETWIGEPEQNRAWELLEQTRSRLIAWERDYLLADLVTLERAWNEIYIAEGSDWFWWYYSHNKSGQDTTFDTEFRTHLGNVYRIIGLPVPPELKVPILAAVEARFRRITATISPRLSTEEVASLEWAGAGYVEPELSTGAMHRAGGALKRLYFGYDPADLYFRLEANEDLAPFFIGIYLASPRSECTNEQTRFGGSNPAVQSASLPVNWEICLFPGASQAMLYRAAGQGIWEACGALASTAVGRRTLEVSVPLHDLGIRPGHTVDLVLNLARDQVLLEVLPTIGYLSFTLASAS